MYVYKICTKYMYNIYVCIYVIFLVLFGIQLANGKDILCQQIEAQYSLYTYITFV